MPLDHDLARLVARNTNTQPVYMSPVHAQQVLQLILNAEPSALRSPSRLGAFVRKLRGNSAERGSSDERSVDRDPAGADRAEADTDAFQMTAYAPLWMGEDLERLDWGMTLKDGIACINLDTAISARGHYYCGYWYHGYDSLDAAVTEALNDPRVNGIFLRMDSPGGVVDDGLNVLTETLRVADKPIWTYADMSCSAAYWIAAQTPWIVAPTTGQVGSIGACIVHTEYSGWLKAEGVKTTGIVFGDRKLDGAHFQSLSDDALAHLQAFVDEAGETFVDAVIEGRTSLSRDAVLDMQARWYGATHRDAEMSGLALGLCDDVMNERAAFEALVEAATPSV